MDDGCPRCDGPGVYLGKLGSATWLRCRNCGWEFMADGPDDDPDGDDPYFDDLGDDLSFDMDEP